jgi:hypothetical protein
MVSCLGRWVEGEDEGTEDDQSQEATFSAPWAKYFDEERQAFYYFNHRTGESLWQLPLQVRSDPPSLAHRSHADR